MPKASPQKETRDPIAAAAALAAGQVQIGAEPQVIVVGDDQLPGETEPEKKKEEELIGGEFKTVDALLAEYKVADRERRASAAEFQRLNPLIKKAQQLEPFLDMAASDADFRDHVMKYQGFSDDPSDEIPEDISQMQPKDLAKLVERRVEARVQAAFDEDRQQRSVEARNEAQFTRLREEGLEDPDIDELLTDLRQNPATLVDVHRSRNLDKIVQAAVDKATKGLVGSISQRRAPSVGAAGGPADDADGIVDFVSKFKKGIVDAAD